MKKSILIVDDNDVNRAVLQNILKDEYEVLEAVNGKQALDILTEKHDEISAVILDIIMPVMDGFEVLEKVYENPMLSSTPIIVTTIDNTDGTEKKALALGANDFIRKPYDTEIIRHRLHNTIKLRESALIANSARFDELTGLLNRPAFYAAATEMIQEKSPSSYVMASFDIDRFKIINDQYGNKTGDAVLKHIADVFSDGFGKLSGICARFDADHYAVLYPREIMDSKEGTELCRRASEYNELLVPLTFSIGRYIVDDKSLSASAMYDRATLAQASVKGRYDRHIALYDESMRFSILREQEITSEMKQALHSDQFEAWFQPQYNHSTSALIGAEVLARWNHPKKGIITPGEFIKVFEKNGFIYELDKYIWEQACACLRQWTDEGRNPVPLSVNISRYDILRDTLVDDICGLIGKYSLPAEMLRLEITESAFSEVPQKIISVASELVSKGFTVEIDDFGSGYSSLNALKDVPAQVVKLDMRFLEGKDNLVRGGSIIESIVRMTRWLGMSVIAEGVETLEQADYLKSVGCSYVQGYYYAKPMCRKDYERIAPKHQKEKEMITMQAVENLDNDAFWNPSSVETLIFNSYVGGASVF